jgi:CPA2 family monovalent cation:H+ antiporter-2
MAEVGVILLLFGVGLHFHPKDLAAVKRVAVTGAAVRSGAAAALGALAGRAMGWGWMEGLVFGLAISVASTVVMVRVLGEHGHLHSPPGRIAVGWLIVEDIFTVLVLVVMPVLVRDAGAGIGKAVGWAVVELAVFSALVLGVGRKLVPLLLNLSAATGSRELFTLSVLALALGIAGSASYFFHVSMALGAFLAGMTVGQTDFSARAGSEALPMRDAFAVMFFLSVGMLFDPKAVWESAGLVAAALGIILVAKTALTFGLVAGMGYGSKSALRVAMVSAQIGEFSFVMGSLGRQLGMLPEAGMSALVAAAMVTIVLNPMLYGLADRMEGALAARPVLWRWLNGRRGRVMEEAEPEVAAHRAIVVGYGPIGRAVTRLLRERGIEPTVVELNVGTFQALKKAGVRVVYGDANHSEVLIEASSLILSSSGAAGVTTAIQLARQLNPGIHIVSRADYVTQAPVLRAAGANEVFAGEGELALAMTQSILRDLGATPEQLDEERIRLRAELMSGTVTGV